MRNQIIIELKVKEGYSNHLQKVDEFKGSPVDAAKYILDKYVSTSVLVQMGELAAIDIRNGLK